MHQQMQQSCNNVECHITVNNNKTLPEPARTITTSQDDY
jgi:hypothetical protein